MPVSRVLRNISSTCHTQCRPCGMCLQSTITQDYYYLRLSFPAEAHNKASLRLFQHPILYSTWILSFYLYYYLDEIDLLVPD